MKVQETKMLCDNKLSFLLLLQEFPNLLSPDLPTPVNYPAHLIQDSQPITFKMYTSITNTVKISNLKL